MMALYAIMLSWLSLARHEPPSASAWTQSKCPSRIIVI